MTVVIPLSRRDFVKATRHEFLNFRVLQLGHFVLRFHSKIPDNTLLVQLPPSADDAITASSLFSGPTKTVTRRWTCTKAPETITLSLGGGVDLYTLHLWKRESAVPIRQVEIAQHSCPVH
ncbi:hypothetical protein EVAR_14309_1 [Eumeta japonica]|uniref:Uncharacterized protein n=1 Tax=Eumeta variegata TaxID=151549 RepID=A0A4C1UM28_EUMVA|nr:hypothetical protein EVAR_14309_1 [Eumeta japonica]